MKSLKKYYKKNFGIKPTSLSSNHLDTTIKLTSLYSFISNTFRWQKAIILSVLSNHIVYYATPANLTYAWSFGSLAGVSLVVQIISGVFLAMFYTPHVDLAFASVEFIMRDVNHGWLVRYIHSNGASMFFCRLLSYFTGFVLWFLCKTS